MAYRLGAPFLASITLVVSSGCGHGSNASESLGTPSPVAKACISPPQQFIRDLRFYTLAEGSTFNGKPAAGVFSTSALACTSQDRSCYFLENIRIDSIRGFGYTENNQVFLELSIAGELGHNFSGTLTSIGSLGIGFTVADGSGNTLSVAGVPSM